MKLVLLMLVLPLAGVCSGIKGDSLRAHYSDQISVDSLKRHLYTIADDSFEGRETGAPGQKMAAEYLAARFEEYGLTTVADSGYFQRFYVMETGIDSAVINLPEDQLIFMDDFYFFPSMVADGRRQLEEMHFMGYGIDDSLYSDYANVSGDIKNIVIWEEEPEDKEGNFLISGTEFNSNWSRDFSVKLEAAKEKGVENMFIISDDYNQTVSRLGYYLTVPNTTLKKEKPVDPKMAVYYISEKTAKTLLGKEYNPRKIKHRIARKEEGQSFKVDQSVDLMIDKSKAEISTENVLALVEGNEQKEEYLVITAHYDHLGVRDGEIYNGADDDGSGTVALLELARNLAQAKADGNGPSRSVLFMAVSGEEKGLLGSEYYTNNPAVPLEQTVANLNIDMIGRNDEAHEPNSEYIYIIGSDRLSTTLHEMSEEVNTECCGIELDYTFNDPDDPNRFYYRSDHYNFVKNGIPAIFYFSGVHEDYHQPGDTPDKIQYEKMTAVVRLIFQTAWAISNTEKEIEVDVVEEP